MIKNNLSSKITRILFLPSAFCLLLSVLGGCGYTTRSMISNEFKTIYVKPFVNKIDITQNADSGSKYRIYRPLLDTDITRYVTNKYLADGNLKPVKSETADLILKGEVVEFRKDPLRYDDNEEVAEYRINLVVNLQLWNRKEDKLVWEENGFIGDTTYFTSFASGGVTTKTDDTAITYALDDLARRIVERTVEAW
ncbi:MAG: LptE family protein [Candidatus Omnitrophica bacterium]|nr:LptE family protein [Candidatus Omnitrophota bacterium]